MRTWCEFQWIIKELNNKKSALEKLDVNKRDIKTWYIDKLDIKKREEHKVRNDGRKKQTFVKASQKSPQQQQ